MISYFALPLLFLLVPFSFAFGEVDDFTTDKSLYNKDNKLNISGNVSYDLEIPFVTIQIFTPGKSSFADFRTFPVNSDGSFSHTFHVGGPTWTSDGIYPILVTYDGNLEKSIEYKEFSTPTPSPVAEPEPAPTPTPEPAPTPTPTPEPAPTPTPESAPTPTPTPESSFTTLKLQIPNFPSFDTPPQHYVDRYDSDANYKSWFDSQFPFNSINDVVGYKPTHVDGFLSLDKSPQHYIDRYNDDANYKSWFDSQFPGISIYNILGYEDPISIPDWIRSNAEWWATGAITDSVFISGIEFMLENNVIMISNIPPSGTISEDGIPVWFRNNAHWWSQDLISEDEFVNSLKFLIQEGIIKVN